MKLLFLFLLLTSNCFSQDVRTEELRYSHASKSVFQGTRQLKLTEVYERMKPYPQSFQLIESARNSHFFSTVFATAGSLPLGYSLIRLVQTKEMNWPIFATGIGLVSASIPLSIRYHRQTKRAVDAFNLEIKATAHREHFIEFSLQLQGSGLGVRMAF